MFGNYYKQNISFKDKVLSLDYALILLIIILGVVSVFAMYSTERGNFDYYTKSHIYRFLVFFIIFLILSFLNIRIWFKSAYIFYFIVLLLLIGVSLFGVTASGSTRWINLFIFNLQPSELMKVALIIFLARFYNKIPFKDVNHIKFMIIPIFALFIPFALVLKQPDLGTAVLILISGLSVVWLSGFRIKFFAFSSIILVCLAPVVIAFLKPYQKLRILTFLNPERDPLGAGYQIIQSKIAIGSGGIFGKGYLLGSQSYLDYLPEKHTDFIFTLFSEEFGFVGSVFLLILYGLIIYRIIRIGLISRNSFSKLFCFGFAAAFFIYVAVNMSMVLGLLPIVGAPLPIMSYGGSSMLSMMIGLAIVMSCKIFQSEEIG
jgi:rod shape determining protein RodA